tara:strand:+ start:1065 stop:1829 length:765 start_codon:yes stop_codon:yes gene_type:complete
MSNNISIHLLPQLKDNYSYLIEDKNTKSVIIIDPAESSNITNYVEKNNLNLNSIILTHHHSDHTAGVNDLLKNYKIPVYSPNKEIDGTTNVVFDNDILNLGFIDIKVISTPGHTLDHVVYYSEKNQILFSGDLLFRLGCGRIFEGDLKVMHSSLKKIENLNNKTNVYCGHEYTLNNLNFLMSLFPSNKALKTEKDKINDQLLRNSSSIPFNLGLEKNINPFLSSNSSYYKEYKKSKKFTDFELFSYLRELKDNF